MFDICRRLRHAGCRLRRGGSGGAGGRLENGGGKAGEGEKDEREGVIGEGRERKIWILRFWVGGVWQKAPYASALWI